MTLRNPSDRFADLGDIEPEDAELPHELPQRSTGGSRYVEVEVPIAMSPAEVERRADAVEAVGQQPPPPPSVEQQQDADSRP